MASAHHAEETVELQQKLARVQSLLEAARRVHATIKLDDVLAGVLEIAAKELEADGAFFVSSGQSIDMLTGIYGNLPDDWTHWSERTRIPGYTSAPMLGERGDAFAHLVVYRPAPLSLEEADFLEGLALQSALAVGNAQHHKRTIEWERVQMDLDAARAIQRSLLPDHVPAIDGYGLHFRSTTCYEVGGDYVDVVTLDDGRLMMVLADVAGKGMASAMISMTFRSSFRAMAGTGLPLEEIAARLNDLHWREGVEARRRYVTAILICLDPVNHTLEMVNAGHNPAFLKGIKPDPVLVGASGPPLGMLPGRTYEIDCWQFNQGAQLLLYTDGLTEVFCGDEEFGEERLLGLLGDQSDDAFLDFAWKTLADYTGGARQTDDMTALYLYRGNTGVTS